MSARAPLALVGSLMLVDFADELFSFLPAGATASIRADLGLSYAQAGVVLAMMSAGGLLGLLAMSAVDFVSRRVLGAGGALVYACCMLAFAAGHSFQVLVVAAFLWGAASDAFVHATQVALAELAGDDLDATLARTNLLGSLGALLGPIALAAAALAGIGWRPVFASGGCLMIGYAAVLARLPLPGPRPDGRTPWLVVRAVAGDRRVLRMAVLWGLLTVIDAPFYGFLIAGLESTRGFSPAGATALATSLIAGGMLGYAVLAVRDRRVGDRGAAAGAAMLSGATAVLVAAPWTPVLVLAGLVFGAGMALVWVVLQASVLQLRPGQAGTTQAVVSAFASFEIALPPLIGAAVDAGGLGVGMWCYVAVPILMLGVLVAPHVRNLRPWMTDSASRSRR